jgi:hypothetical protein
MLKILTFVPPAETHPVLPARTVLLFHRPAIPVHALTMRRPADESNMHLKVEVFAEPEQSGRYLANLAELIQVVGVETRKQDPKPARTTLSAWTET